MLRPSWIASLTLAFILVGCAVAAASVTMEIAMQRGAPAHLVQTTHGYPSLLTAARLKNDGKKLITSYRIGWAYLRPDGIEFHVGVLMNVPASLKPGDINDVSDQAIPFDARAQSVIFFVAELSFADGSRWTANNADITPEAGLKVSR